MLTDHNFRPLAFCLIVLACFPTGTPAQLAGAPVATPAVPLLVQPGPRIKFAEMVFDFGRIKSGDVVKHTYVFTNIGNQVLEIENVQPSCGCTAAGEWTKRVEPGQTGTIPIQFNSTSFSGSVVKAVTVKSNDKTQPLLMLQLKAQVWKLVETIPQFAILDVMPDAADAATRVRIVNNSDEFMAITSMECNNASFVPVLVTNTPGKEFELVVKAIPPLKPGSVQAQITIRTSCTHTPILPITVWANIRAAVVTMPPQISLPGGPLATKTLPSVTIQNNSTNSLIINDPSINLPGVDVTLQEIQPGRVFSITVAFPQGFEMPHNLTAALTFKTSHSQFAEVKVPVVQMPRLATPIPISGHVTPTTGTPN